jgi:hypothetical protein
MKMEGAPLLREAFVAVTFETLAVMAVCARSSARSEYSDEFVQGDGTHLTLYGKRRRVDGHGDFLRRAGGGQYRRLVAGFEEVCLDRVQTISEQAK